MRFKEFLPGTVITGLPVELGQDEIVEFAARWDPQWFHTDPDRARDGRFGALIASGWQTCALAMRQAVVLALDGSESFASPGVKYIKWPAPVKAGDQLTFRAEVLEARRSTRQPSLGIVDWRWELLHEDGRQALELEVTSLFDLGAESA